MNSARGLCRIPDIDPLYAWPPGLERDIIRGMWKVKMPGKDHALPGRVERLAVADKHYVNGQKVTPPFPEGLGEAVFGMGCFWGAEKKFWELDGVYSTMVG